ncbi:membrane protein [Arthrobacter phage VroomVroom]|uniref:Membrane protein n=1 Tax=Arthrobacter phage VroomVroom TaxID=3049371 RepID=A0AA49ITJ5_9CAUD|nr:membrane protein [Arthrobacter phage VroomVroom]
MTPEVKLALKVETEALVVLLLVLALAVMLGAFLPLGLAIPAALVGGTLAIGFTGAAIKRQVERAAK